MELCDLGLNGTAMRPRPASFGLGITRQELYYSTFTITITHHYARYYSLSIYANIKHVTFSVSNC